MVVRRPIVGGYWKMNMTRDGATELCHSLLLEAIKPKIDTEIVLYPPYVWLTDAAAILSESFIRLGAQDGLAESNGAITGGVSLTMLSEVVDALLVGHSERRNIFHETANKFSRQLVSALDMELLTTYCVGENQAEQESGSTYQVLQEQIASVFEGATGHHLVQAVNNNPEALVIAYEPVWAIGTGLVAQPNDVQERAKFIRKEISNYCDVSELIRIQYGGSVTRKNAGDFAALKDVDGALVGGASLNAEDFLTICRAFSVGNH